MRHVLLTGILGLFCFQAISKTILVKPSGNKGDGSTWATAVTDLSKALEVAKAGDEVWVAVGTYYPTESDNRSAFFKVQPGVKVYGGFLGDETSIHQRNTGKHKTVLSGDIGSKNINIDNSYTVIAFLAANDQNVLNGFIISGGYADGSGPSSDPERCGGGLYLKIISSNKVATPIIQDCIFKNNYARDGGGVYVFGRKGNCMPQFKDCQFLNNQAQLDGGAIFNDGRNKGKANPHFSNCIFEGNKGNYGGAMCNYGGRGESSPQIFDCIFRNNEAFLRGGAIFNMDIEGKTHPLVNNCQFVDNKAVAGKGMYTFNRYEDKEEGTVSTSNISN